MSRGNTVDITDTVLMPKFRSSWFRFMELMRSRDAAADRTQEQSY